MARKRLRRYAKEGHYRRGGEIQAAERAIDGGEAGLTGRCDDSLLVPRSFLLLSGNISHLYIKRKGGPAQSVLRHVRDIQVAAYGAMLTGAFLTI